MEDNKQIIEALHMQPLSESDKKSRHILGRLYGPIATCTEATRNGRTYNRDLWEKALNDDVFREKVRNKSLFLELGHPENREETDMTKVCACIPEMPKIVGDDLYAYVDILDTDNGRLLKTLCDYGFVPGISSRGSGDVMDNDEVDPDTFFLETWDIVQLPAVKKARLQMAESLDTNKLKLRKALTESINKADAKGKVIMKEALDNLDIKLEDEPKKKDLVKSLAESLSDEEAKQFFDATKKLGLKTISDLEEWSKEHGALEDRDLFNALVSEANKKPIKEAAKDEEDDVETSIEDASIPEAFPFPGEEEDNTLSEAKEDDESEDDEDTDAAEEESKDTEDKDTDEEESDSISLNDISDIKALKDFVKGLDKDTVVNLSPTTVEDKPYLTSIVLTKNKDGSLTVSTDLTPSDVPDLGKEESTNDEATAEEPSAKDDGEDNSTVECLKEALRQKAALLKELRQLKSQSTVGNSEVKKLKEDCEKYKFAFQRLSAVSDNNSKLKKQVNELSEALKASKSKIESLEKDSKIKLTESVNANRAQLISLQEKLDAANGNIANYKKLAESRANIAQSYKNKCSAILNKYIEFRAKMIEVKPSDITSKLSESYTLNDIDAVCDNLLKESVSINRLPFGVKKMSIQQKPSATINSDGDGYPVDDDLLEWAGLK